MAFLTTYRLLWAFRHWQRRSDHRLDIDMSWWYHAMGVLDTRVGILVTLLFLLKNNLQLTRSLPDPFCARCSFFPSSIIWHPLLGVPVVGTIPYRVLHLMEHTRFGDIWKAAYWLRIPTIVINWGGDLSLLEGSSSSHSPA